MALKKHWTEPFGIVDGPGMFGDERDTSTVRVICPLGCGQDMLVVKPNPDRVSLERVSLAMGAFPDMLVQQALFDYQTRLENKIREHVQKNHKIEEWVAEVTALRGALTDLLVRGGDAVRLLLEGYGVAEDSAVALMWYEAVAVEESP